MAASEEAKRAYLYLVQSEKKDRYIEACNASPINARARVELSYIPWHDQELAKVCMSIYEQLKLKPKQVQFVILHPSADGGMPHTRQNNTICIPAHFPLDRLIQTIRHEAVHLQQKAAPEAWKMLLEAEGWKEYPESLLQPEIVSRCRYNPDTLQSRFWSYKNRWIPLPMFQREDKPSLRDVKIRWYDLKYDSLVDKRPDSLDKRYGYLPEAAWEHPYEIYAYSTEYSALPMLS